MDPLPYQEETILEFQHTRDVRLPYSVTDDDIARLSKVDRAVVLDLEFETEIFNGGLEQWLSNPTGGFARETLSALMLIGANKTAEIVREVIQMFPKSRLANCRYWKQAIPIAEKTG